MKKLLLRFTGVSSFILGLAGSAHADWTPLITADDFTGIQTDMMTVAGGIISVTLIIIGVSYLVRAMVK